MKTPYLLLGIVAIIGISVVAPAHGQTITASPTAPVTSGDDINNFISGSIAGGDYTNHNPPGQTFLTGSASASYLLDSITVEGGGNAGFFENQPFTLSIYTISGTTLTPVDSETYTFPDTDISSDYLTFTPSSPIALAANTEYAFTIGNTPDGFGGISNPSSWYGFVDSNATGSTYPDGTAINANVPVSGSTTSTSFAPQGYDMSFAVALSAAPEPSTWAMMFGGVAVLLGMLRFRRRTL